MIIIALLSALAITIVDSVRVKCHQQVLLNEDELGAKFRPLTFLHTSDPKDWNWDLTPTCYQASNAVAHHSTWILFHGIWGDESQMWNMAETIIDRDPTARVIIPQA